MQKEPHKKSPVLGEMLVSLVVDRRIVGTQLFALYSDLQKNYTDHH